MWLLLLIVLNGTGPKETVLLEYQNQEACETEKVRVELEWHQSYPPSEWKHFRFDCRKKKMVI